MKVKNNFASLNDYINPYPANVEKMVSS